VLTARQDHQTSTPGVSNTLLGAHVAALGDSLAASDRGTPVDAETVFDILSNQRRRMVLKLVKSTDAEMSIDVGTLSREIAAREKGTSLEAIDYADRKSVYTSLQQSHLPTMADAGVIAFDERAGTVEATEETAGYTLYLEVVNDEDIPWHGYYLGLAAIAGSLLVAVQLDAAVFGQLSALTVLAFVTVSLLVSAGAHTYFARQRRVSLSPHTEETQ